MAAEEGQVISVHSVQEWEDFLRISKDDKKLLVVDFTASWCGPCKTIAPFLVELAKRITHVVFLKVDVDELNTVAENWSVEAMPTFLFLKDGKVVDKVVGAKKAELQSTVEKHAAATASA